MKALIKHTRVVQTIEVNSQTEPRTSGLIFPISKARTIDKLKSTLPFPHKFFYDLNRLNIATYADQWGTKVTIQLTEIDPKKEDAKHDAAKIS